MKNLIFDSNYIHDDKVLEKIYSDAVKKFFCRAENEIIFYEVCDYVYRKLIQKKQDTYSHSLHIVKEVCQRVGEDFYAAIEHTAPNANVYKDVWHEIFNN